MYEYITIIDIVNTCCLKPMQMHIIYKNEIILLS